MGSITGIILIALCIWLILKRKRKPTTEREPAAGFEKPELDSSKPAHRNELEARPQELPGEHQRFELPSQTKPVELAAN